MKDPSWSQWARERIAGRRLVLVGIGVEQMFGFVNAGAKVVGAISVVPSGGPSGPSIEAFVVPPGKPPELTLEPFDVLTMSSTTRDILEHVVWGYASAIANASDIVGSFLDRVDPSGDAIVASYLPLPHATLGGREAWTADSAVTLPLEQKSGAHTPLAGVVPVIPSVLLPAGDPHEWWPATCSTLQADRLVIQAAGISGGGTGTYVCAGPDDVPTVDGFVFPFVEGLAGNVMGVVDDDGTTLVLPASRQLVRIDATGRPLYAGNVTGEEWATEARDAIGDEVRAIGRTLGEIGFFGPFGVDFIVTADGTRLYHDLNPRMNGVVDSLAFLSNGARPQISLSTLVLSRPTWDPDHLEAVEAALHRDAQRRPWARLWLTAIAERPRTITTVPAGGTWHVDVDNAAVSFVSVRDIGRPDVRGARSDRARLQPTIAASIHIEPGDRVVVGNLFCEPSLADAMDGTTIPALVDAFLA